MCFHGGGHILSFGPGRAVRVQAWHGQRLLLPRAGLCHSGGVPRQFPSGTVPWTAVVTEAKRRVQVCDVVGDFCFLLVSFRSNFSVGCIKRLLMGKHQHWVTQSVTIIEVLKV